MRRYGAFEIAQEVGALHEEPVPDGRSSTTCAVDDLGRVYTRAPKPAGPNIVPLPTPDPDAEGRRPVGVEIDGEVVRGFPTPQRQARVLLAHARRVGLARGGAIPTYMRSHVHPERLAPDQMVLISTFRLPVQIHTRSANAKWLDEIAHTNPLWLHPSDAARLGVQTGDLVRVETEIGHFVVKAWVTEGIRPGVVACSHHMGRWKPDGEAGQRQSMATVDLDRDGSRWSTAPGARASRPSPRPTPTPSASGGPTSACTRTSPSPYTPTPSPGMHCWHQAVRVTPGRARTTRYGDISVDTERALEVYREWLAQARPAQTHLPRRDSPTLLAAAPAEACAGRLPAPRRTATGLLMSELLRALGALAEPPVPAAPAGSPSARAARRPRRGDWTEAVRLPARPVRLDLRRARRA